MILFLTLTELPMTGRAHLRQVYMPGVRNMQPAHHDTTEITLDDGEKFIVEEGVAEIARRMEGR